jgi:DNA ligase-1
VNDYQNLENFWISEKLDGVRGHWTGKILLTKNGHTIKVPLGFTNNWPDTPLDGELWLGRNTFDKISSLIRRKNSSPDSWQHVRFMVFDLPSYKGNFTERIAMMKTLFLSNLTPNIVMIEQNKGTTYKALQYQLDDLVAQGAEGLMLHHEGSLYFNGRSQQLIKVKKYYDAEALVIKHISGKGRNADRLGSLLVRLDNGKTFKIGTGFSDIQRINPPPIGSTITFKYYGKTANNIPRFASFIRIRTTFISIPVKITTKKE